MDQYTLNTQKWLKKTYAGLYSVDALKEDGKTGQDTIDALIAALQVELGLSNPNGTLGPATHQAIMRLETITLSKTFKPNIIKILQGACYAKGYDAGGGDLTGKYTESTGGAAIRKLKSGITGIAESSQTANVDYGIWLVLLSMKQFVVLPAYGGDMKTRSIQQELNRNYIDYIGSYVATDGIAQRDTITGIIYAIQKEEGFPSDSANGNFGPATSSNFPTLSPNMQSPFVKILKWCLHINGYKNLIMNNTLDSTCVYMMNAFQRFMALPVVPYADSSLMKNLLLSTGEQNRPVKGADMATPLTQQHITALKNDAYAYEYVGRYITHGIINGKDKCLTMDEVNLIIANKMKIFPIYQSSANYINYFTEEQGRIDARNASLKAVELRFPADTTIYFAVDVDIMEGDIYGTVLPYFKGVYSEMSSRGLYKVGIYAARNTCTIVSNSGYAVNSFVSGMSTGFSGNLGFPMPKNWAFNQIGPGVAGSLEIDNVVVSGRDTGVSRLLASQPTNNEIEESKNKLENKGSSIAKKVFEKFIDFGNNVEVGFQFDKTYVIDEVTYGGWKMKRKIEASLSAKNTTQENPSMSFTTNSDGSINTEFKNDVLGLLGGWTHLDGMKPQHIDDIVSSLESIAITIDGGQISTYTKVNSANSIEVGFVILSEPLLSSDFPINSELEVTFIVELTADPDYKEEISWDFVFELALAVGVGVAIFFNPVAALELLLSGIGIGAVK